MGGRASPGKVAEEPLAPLASLAGTLITMPWPQSRSHSRRGEKGGLEKGEGGGGWGDAKVPDVPTRRGGGGGERLPSAGRRGGEGGREDGQTGRSLAGAAGS